jgi:hypothetical protein
VLEQQRHLRVEIHAYGGWWKDSEGRKGQVSHELTSKGPMLTVAMVSNGLGKDGWELTDVVSAPHNIYHLTLKR